MKRRNLIKEIKRSRKFRYTHNIEEYIAASGGTDSPAKLNTVCPQGRGNKRPGIPKTNL